MLSEVTAPGRTQDPDAVEIVGKALHRSRNLVMACRGYADMIARRPAEAERHEEWARKLVHQLDRLTELHRRISVLSREAGGAQERISLPLLLSGAAEEARRCVDRPDVEVRLDGGTGLELLGEPDHLLLALVSLIENALEASPPSGTVSISLRTRSDGAWQLRIADGGPGLGEDPDHWRDHPFTSTKPGRLGLGLYLSRKILQRHELALRLENAVAGGAVAVVSPPTWNESTGGQR